VARKSGVAVTVGCSVGVAVGVGPNASRASSAHSIPPNPSKKNAATNTLIVMISAARLREG
jgi:hypothetical protein